MALNKNIPADLYETAIALFCNAGHMVTPEPIFYNHSPEQIVYFDNNSGSYLSHQQRALLTSMANVSHLFDADNECFKVQTGDLCGFYSIELLTSYTFRSQAAYDIHKALIPFLPGVVNIILFRHDGKLMLSMQDFKSNIILSDWYDETDEIDHLTDRLSISNISLNSVHDYINDIIYSCARWYYIYPISKELVTYDMLPLDRFSWTFQEPPTYSKDDLKEMVRDSLRIAEKEYGDDFIDEEENSNKQDIDISAELDMLILELDMTEELETSLFEGIDDYEDEMQDYNEKDEYEFDNYAEDIFRDPLQMIKFLESSEKITTMINHMLL